MQRIFGVHQYSTHGQGMKFVLVAVSFTRMAKDEVARLVKLEYCIVTGPGTTTKWFEFHI